MPETGPLPEDTQVLRRTQALPLNNPQRPARITRTHVEHMLAMGGPTMIFQPILCLRSALVYAYEALARFPGQHSPPSWFDASARVALGAEVQAIAVHNARQTSAHRPTGTRVAINLSPYLVRNELILDALEGDLTGIIIEFTENGGVSRNPDLEAAAALLRQQGATIALDDFGAGFSGLQRALGLNPELIKVEQKIVRGLSHDSARRNMVAGIVSFAHRAGAQVCAEGVESLDDLSVLTEIGVDYAQGWIVGPGHPEFLSPDPRSIKAVQCTSPIPMSFDSPARVTAQSSAVAGLAGNSAHDVGQPTADPLPLPRPVSSRASWPPICPAPRS